VNWIREKLFSAVGLHAIGFGILAIATIVLGVRVGLDWRAISAGNRDEVAGKQAELRALTIQTAPLRGLGAKVDDSRKQIDAFYAKRIPPSYSAILEAIGQLKAKAPVVLSRAGYTQAVGSGDLTEIRIDAGLSGDYAGIMRFVNGLERSQTFFVIRAMALTGQQSGTVNLRLQVSTWLRPEDAAASGLPVDGAPGTQPAGDGDSGAPQPAGTAKVLSPARPGRVFSASASQDGF
jgi:type IV pilus assembly protein PilO